MAIFNKALKAIIEGRFAKTVINEDKEATASQKTNEEEVINWMLAKTMMDRKDQRYRSVIAHVLTPKGVKFDTTQFTIKDIAFFVSPQTALTSEDNDNDDPKPIAKPKAVKATKPKEVAKPVEEPKKAEDDWKDDPWFKSLEA